MCLLLCLRPAENTINAVNSYQNEVLVSHSCTWHRIPVRDATILQRESCGIYSTSSSCICQQPSVQLILTS